ncbi:MAG: MFS transporter [Sphaerochaeta sp.]|jgi:PPP family 3-phenylpropionic acid transporter|uniref:MFS transporter n=1 Tax=Sphaerochaeta sp. TaxID=1972642 RepID=UPI001DC3B2FD|nr:MFS transporter [uncultured Sphaerochaeta sp.]MDD3058418.1 MFS transporter [Sphaerochaeta sp.]MDD3928922.1 MFS transporter [Sphaerochaeta sp.]NCC13282.1 MFS transporter [Spirochaetia bacterium]NCC90615.1 MFS transporter [Spirochaetia bacterium]
MVSLYISFFFVYAIYAVINPFLQVMLRNLGYSYDMVGVLLSIFEVAGIVGPLVLARRIDKRGDMRGALLFGTAFTSLGVAILMFSRIHALTVLGLVVVAFFMRSLLPILDSYVNNLFNGDAQKYTALRSFGTVGFVFFSLAFALANKPNLESNISIGMYALVGCLMFFIPVLFWKAEPKRAKGSCLLVSEPEGKWYDRAFIVGLVIIAFNRISMSSITSFFSLYLVEELSINAISLMNAIGAGSEYGAMILAGILIQRKKVLPVHLLMISSVAMVVRLLIYAFVPTFGGVLAAQLLHSLCYGFFHPAAIFFVARRVKRSHRTVGMSMYVSLGTGLPAVIGSSLGGLVVEQFGYRSLFMGYSLFALLSLLLSIVFYRVMTTPAIEEI